MAASKKARWPLWGQPHQEVPVAESFCIFLEPAQFGYFYPSQNQRALYHTPFLTE